MTEDKENPLDEIMKKAIIELGPIHSSLLIHSNWTINEGTLTIDIPKDICSCSDKLKTGVQDSLGDTYRVEINPVTTLLPEERRYVTLVDAIYPASDEASSGKLKGLEEKLAIVESTRKKLLGRDRVEARKRYVPSSSQGMGTKQILDASSPRELSLFPYPFVFVHGPLGVGKTSFVRAVIDSHLAGYSEWIKTATPEKAQRIPAPRVMYYPDLGSFVDDLTSTIEVQKKMNKDLITQLKRTKLLVIEGVEGLGKGAKVRSTETLIEVVESILSPANYGRVILTSNVPLEEIFPLERRTEQRDLYHLICGALNIPLKTLDEVQIDEKRDMFYRFLARQLGRYDFDNPRKQKRQIKTLSEKFFPASFQIDQALGVARVYNQLLGMTRNISAGRRIDKRRDLVEITKEVCGTFSRANETEELSELNLMRELSLGAYQGLTMDNEITIAQWVTQPEDDPTSLSYRIKAAAAFALFLSGTRKKKGYEMSVISRKFGGVDIIEASGKYLPSSIPDTTNAQSLFTYFMGQIKS